jgi:hypothetical protein
LRALTARTITDPEQFHAERISTDLGQRPGTLRRSVVLEQRDGFF